MLRVNLFYLGLLSTSPFHLRMALGEFKYPKRTFVVVRSLNRNPNRSGTCAVSDLINLLDSMADFSEISTVAGLCLKSCYEETTAPNKVKNKGRSKESDPEMELYSSQPSTQGGSQPMTKLIFKEDHQDFSSLLSWSSRNTIPIIGIDNVPGSNSLRKTVLPSTCILLFGQENVGLSSLARQNLGSGNIRHIDQFGSTRSINAGAAAAIAMYSWISQHAQ